MEAEFKRLDADGDGIITASDLVKASAAGGGACALLGRNAAALTSEEATAVLEELVAEEGSKVQKAELGLTLAQVGDVVSCRHTHAKYVFPPPALGVLVKWYCRLSQ